MTLSSVPVDTLYYATVVTRDAKALARNHAEFYGIEKWQVSHLSPDRLTNTSFRGRGRGKPPDMDLAGPNPAPGEFGFTMATGTNEHGLTFQIIEPTIGLSTFEQFVVTRGTGVHSVFMTVVEREKFNELRQWLAGEGVGIAQSFTADGAVDYYYFDTRKALGGFYLQVVVPREGDWRTAIRVNEEWDFSGEFARPAESLAPTRTNAIPHFGVVVPDVEEKVAVFSRFFAQPLWRGMNWRTEQGSLEDTTYNGSPVKHAYFTGRSDIGKTPTGVGFGFEIVQPTFGPSHYKEDFLQVIGPGIHHVDLLFPVEDWDEWEALNGWLAEKFDAPTCMSGWLRGRSALFQYQDTRSRLGYVTEIHAPRPPGKPRMRSAPDYWYDFSVAAPEPA